MKTTKVLGVIASICLLAACTQETSSETATTQAANEPTASVAEASAEVPDKVKGASIAIVQNTGQGDYFQQYLNGTRQQAAALGLELSVYDAQGDNSTQASQLDQAIASGAKGIIVRHGFADTLCPGVNKAIKQGITVVAYDVEIQQCAPKAIQTQQSDKLMASLVLDLMKDEVATGSEVGYVNVAGIAPLDRRDAVWREYVKENDWKEKFKTGKYTASTATDSAPMVDNALKANNGVTGIYAPYDELTKATLTALQQNPNLKDKVYVYGADISTADIALMIEEGSPWRATGATDPNAIGAAVVRTLALQLAGELKETKVEFPPILITQDYLRENKITNMDQLREKNDKLNISDVSSADWIPAVTF